MSVISSVVTTRKTNQLSWWENVFEWEDVFAKGLGVDYSDFVLASDTRAKVYRAYEKIIHKVGLPNLFQFHTNDKYSIAFVMYARDLWQYKNANIIPIILDAPSWAIKDVYEITKRIPAFWVTSLDFYNLLMDNYPKCKAHYFPLSVAKKWQGGVDERVFDVIQLGRKNDKLHAWMIEYNKAHPQVNYIYQESRDNYRHYVSTLYGPLEKEFASTREKYMRIMRQSKICLLSSPSVDSNNKFGDIDFPTPRFYEAAICGCRLIGRYTRNEEFHRVGISDICPNIDSYEGLCDEIEKALYIDDKELRSRQELFISNNTTERRLDQFIREMETIL